MIWLFWAHCFVLIVSVYTSSDIVGCGGFLKSQMAIDFSKVNVKLYVNLHTGLPVDCSSCWLKIFFLTTPRYDFRYTNQGTLKESSDCAPTNGYYFIPLSDKGEYTLKIEPPSGWFFEPKEVPILFDGVNDPCSLSLDINFNFKGFAVTGTVGAF